MSADLKQPSISSISPAPQSSLGAIGGGKITPSQSFFENTSQALAETQSQPTVQYASINPYAASHRQSQNNAGSIEVVDENQPSSRRKRKLRKGESQVTKKIKNIQGAYSSSRVIEGQSNFG